MKIKSTQDYMNKLAELGVDAPKSQLRTRFQDAGTLGGYYGSELTNSEASTKYTAPPLIEDLSHLNPASTKQRAGQARKAWLDLSPVERARRIRFLSSNGKEGGKARRFSVRLSHPTLYKKAN